MMIKQDAHGKQRVSRIVVPLWIPHRILALHYMAFPPDPQPSLLDKPPPVLGTPLIHSTGNTRVYAWLYLSGISVFPWEKENGDHLTHY